MLALDQFGFFERLSDEDKTYLTNSLKPIEVPANSILFYQGDLCSDILLLSEGELKLSLYGDTEDAITLYRLCPGEQCIVNTSSVISTSPAIATAETLTPVRGWLLPKAHFKSLLIESETYRDYIFSLFTIKLSSLATVIEEIKFTRLEDRLIKYLKSRQSPRIEMTHEMLAAELGSSRVVISRLLKTLESQQKIKLHRGFIEILSL